MRRSAFVLEMTTSLIELAGMATVSCGASMVYRPLGFILWGLFLILLGIALSPKGEKR
jgi:membrane protein DedA with SNARE-associated domain